MSSKEHFLKFPKIEPLETTDNFPIPKDARNSDWYVSEKIDGCNIGMCVPIDEKKPVRFYSRNGMDADGLFNFKEDKKQLDVLIRDLRKYCTNEKRVQRCEGVYEPFCEYLYLWGEYYGSNVNRRIDYGVNGAFKFYNMTNGLDWCASPFVFNRFFSKFVRCYPESEKFILFSKNITDFADLSYRCSNRSDLMNAFKFPIRSVINPSANAEGVVFTRMPIAGGTFDRWKWKDPAFSERPCIGTKKTDLDDDYSSLHSDFVGYVNKNRAYSVVSKTPERNIGKLCVLLIKDAKEDFLHDNKDRIKGKSNDYMKKVYNVGSIGFEAIKSVLSEFEEK